jgi:hypothetical protein
VRLNDSIDIPKFGVVFVFINVSDGIFHTRPNDSRDRFLFW